MWKRTILVALCLVILFAYPVYAVEPRITVNQPTLEFSGTTALCEFRITNFGKSISVTLELWNGSTLVDSWTRSGSSVVTISETCTVVSGRTYTLVVHGTCGGESFSSTSIAKRCP